MRVIDSVGWIAYFTGHVLAAHYRPLILQQAELICPTIIVYEVSKKVELQLGRQSAAMAVAQLLKTRVVSLNHSIAAAAAQASIEHKLPMADAIIYTTARLAGAVLVTSDAHLCGLPGVDFVPIQPK